MKLLFCTECSSVFSLSPNKVKSCDCGKTSGRYIDNLNATYSGNGIPLGFNNRSFMDSAISFYKSGVGNDFTAFVISDESKTIVKE